MKLLSTVLGFILLISACKVEEVLSPEERLQKDISSIKTYLADNGLLDDAIETETGLHYHISEAGTDTITPTGSSVVYMRYKGYLLDGTTFDITGSAAGCLGISDSCSTLEPNETIVGFEEGLSYFNTGSKGSIYIPSALGYGSATRTNIPSNSVLIFDLDILEILK